MATPSSSSTLTEPQLTQQLQQLRTQLTKKQSFESAVNSIKSLLISNYSSSSPVSRKLFYDVVSRVATVLCTRYSAVGFFIAGADLMTVAEQLVTDPLEKSYLKNCLSKIQEHLPVDGDGDNDQQDHRNNSSNSNGGYLFEGQLSMDEPPQPRWLIQQNLLAALAAASTTTMGADSEEQNNNPSNFAELVESMNLQEGFDEALMANLEEFLQADGTPAGRGAPPASKAAVEKLPVVKVDEEILKKVGEEDAAECCICKEKLVVGDEMQELPCKHLFHPECLKPWFDERNSCPICRHELPTDDHKYESWKEREKELEEERRGAANAVRGGEFMYI